MFKKSSSLKWILLHTKGCKLNLSCLFLTRTAITVINLIMAIILGAFTNYATNSTLYSLKKIALATLLIFLIEGVIYVIESINRKKIFTKIEGKIRLTTLSHIQTSDVKIIEQSHSSELMTRLTKDTELVANCLPNIIINLFGGMLMAIASFVYMFFLNWKLCLIIIISFPCLALSISIFSPFVQKESEKEKKADEINRSTMQEALRNIPLMQVFYASSLLANKVKDSYLIKSKYTIKLGYIEGLFSFLNSFIGSAMFLITMGFGAFFASRQEISVGDMIAIINLLNYIVWPFSNISQTVAEFNQALVSAERIRALQNLPSKTIANNFKYVNKQEETYSAVVAENVSFYYNKNEYIINNANFKLENGNLIGLVGKSGSGKSTLIKLLLGIYVPQVGNITFFTNNFESTKDKLFPLLSYVPSNNYVFTGTVKENICLTDLCDEKKLQKCAELSNSDGFINAFEHGYDELITENGNSLSSGQAQRIAIARALYHDSQVLILDEPTSNLDFESIKILKSTLHSLAQEKLCIVISHDKTVIESCDSIILLKENGTLSNISSWEAEQYIQKPIT